MIDEYHILNTVLVSKNIHLHRLHLPEQELFNIIWNDRVGTITW